jgi:hypothetical protein
MRIVSQRFLAIFPPYFRGLNRKFVEVTFSHTFDFLFHATRKPMCSAGGLRRPPVEAYFFHFRRVEFFSECMRENISACVAPRPLQYGVVFRGISAGKSI